MTDAKATAREERALAFGVWTASWRRWLHSIANIFGQHRMVTGWDEQNRLTLIVCECGFVFWRCSHD